MTDHETPQLKLSELWARIWPLILILAVTTIGWFLLSNLAFHARAHDSVEIARGPSVQDYKQGKDWATELLGLAGVFAGFLGIAAATRRWGLSPSQRAASTEGGTIGVLAGATLLGVGGWAVPIALVALVAGAATLRAMRILRRGNSRPMAATARE